MANKICFLCNINFDDLYVLSDVAAPVEKKLIRNFRRMYKR